MAAYKLDRAMHLTHAPGDPEAKAVEEGDPEGHFVLGAAGIEIPDADAQRYGLLKDKEEAPAEAKALESPPADKALHRAAKK